MLAAHKLNQLSYLTSMYIKSQLTTCSINRCSCVNTESIILRRYWLQTRPRKGPPWLGICCFLQSFAKNAETTLGLSSSQYWCPVLSYDVITEDSTLGCAASWGYVTRGIPTQPQTRKNACGSSRVYRLCTSQYKISWKSAHRFSTDGVKVTRAFLQLQVTNAPKDAMIVSFRITYN